MKTTTEYLKNLELHARINGVSPEIVALRYLLMLEQDREAAQTGAEFLDKKMPGWVDRLSEEFIEHMRQNPNQVNFVYETLTPEGTNALDYWVYGRPNANNMNSFWLPWIDARRKKPKPVEAPDPVKGEIWAGSKGARWVYEIREFYVWYSPSSGHSATYCSRDNWHTWVRETKAVKIYPHAGGGK